MSTRVLVADFTAEGDLFAALAVGRDRGWPVVDVFTPYPVHGLDRALGMRRSRLSVACFLCGLLGASLALWFQFWASSSDWPLNVGGQPWNSLPAFVPVTFETMVLFAGLGLVLAWLIRCQLYPGKVAMIPSPGVTDNRFVLVLGQAAIEEAREYLEGRAVPCEERVV
jgi:hypothetical protein